MKLYTPSSPHTHAENSISQVMMTVVKALLPGIVVYWWLFGWGVIAQLSLGILTALIAETIMLKLRDRPLGPFILDGSAIVTAMLLALSIPPTAPWWIIILGTTFAIVVAKHLYGGLGYNVFNPAMVGYAILLISFPKEMTTWLAPEGLQTTALDMQETAKFIFANTLPNGVTIDTISSATPLDYIKTQLGLGHNINSIVAESAVFGELAGKGYEWVSVSFLLGGLFLFYKRIIQWQIPLAMLLSITVLSATFYTIDPTHYASPVFHLFAGATMLGAFFIATDPVSAATTPRGRLIYGAGIGILVYLIRTWGGYPDGIAFGVLIMNMSAPLIDYYTKPRAFGHENK